MVGRQLYYENVGYDFAFCKECPTSGIRRFFDLVNEMKDAISLA